MVVIWKCKRSACISKYHFSWATGRLCCTSHALGKSEFLFVFLSPMVILFVFQFLQLSNSLQREEEGATIHMHAVDYWISYCIFWMYFCIFKRHTCLYSCLQLYLCLYMFQFLQLCTCTMYMHKSEFLFVFLSPIALVFVHVSIFSVEHLITEGRGRGNNSHACSSLKRQIVIWDFSHLQRKTCV